MTRAGLRGAAAFGWISFFSVILAAWTLLFLMQPAPPDIDLTSVYGLDAWRALCRVDASQAAFPVLFAMWALMSAAMMAPTAIPALKTYADLIHAGAGTRAGAALLLVGYLGVWLGYAAVAALAQQALASASLLDPLGRSAEPSLTAALLAVVGLYQFSRLKEACLSRCRAPFAFFMAHWRPGALGALVMGARLGAVCVGCCWALMLLAFAFGTMSLAWMGLATLLMALEKLPDLGRLVTRPLGVALIAAAGWTLLAAHGS